MIIIFVEKVKLKPMRKSNFVYIAFIGLLLLLSSCGTKSNTTDANAEPINIDLIPMYGSVAEFGDIQKTPEQNELISDFLIASDNAEPDRKVASYMYWEIAMNYIDNGKYDEAMKRTNQAWLLDPLNADVYVAFATILSLQEDHKSALNMFDRAINLAPNKVIILPFYLDEAYIYYKESKDNSHLKCTQNSE